MLSSEPPLTTILTKQGHERNTFNLPTGTDIQRDLVGIFKDQHAAILAFVEESKSWNRLQVKWGLPIAWPSWDSLGLGASNIIERLEGAVTSIWEKAGAAFLALLGLDPDGWDANDPRNKALIEQGLKDLATEVNNTTSQQLQAALDTVTKEVADGKITTDQAEAELTKDVDQIFDAAETWRAQRIAITEAARNYHAAIAAAASEFGDVAGWKWLCAEGACPICLEIEAECQFVPTGRAFAVIGNNPTYQNIDYPPAHPLCRCSMEPVMAGDEPNEWGDTLIQPTGITEGFGRSEADVTRGSGVPESMDVASLVGAPDDATVTAIRLLDGGIYINARGDGYEGRVIVYPDHLELSSLYIAENKQGQGLGTEILGRMIEAAERAGTGLKGITLRASRDDGDVGYKVWPKLGFDGPLPENLIAGLPETIAGARRVSDLMMTPEGVAWWNQHGETVNLTFDLSPQSLSRQVWDGYLKAREATE